MLSSQGNVSNVLLPYVPPYVTTSVTNNEGKRLVEVCIWLQSGLQFDDINVAVTDDHKHLLFEVIMDRLMGDGWGVHNDLIPNGHEMPDDMKLSHIRISHWNAVIGQMQNNLGGLPWFSSQIELPEEVRFYHIPP